jgi:predicted Fe-S protein YdhL (DUF1289 family)
MNVAGADPMPGGLRFDGQTVQAIGIERPCVVPACRVARSNLCHNRPRFADLCAQWHVIKRAQKFSVVLRIVEIDFHISRTNNIGALQAVLRTDAKFFSGNPFETSDAIDPALRTRKAS